MSSLSLDTSSISSSDRLEGRAARLARAQRLDRDESVAQEMEGLFAQMLVKEMRRGLGEGFFGKGAGADTFEGWLDEHLADSLAREGVLDLAGRIRTDLEQGRRDAAREETSEESA